jgi:hypothetical protein
VSTLEGTALPEQDVAMRESIRRYYRAGAIVAPALLPGDNGLPTTAEEVNGAG